MVAATFTRRKFLRRAMLAGGAGAGAAGLYTWRWEPHWVEFVERPLPLENLPAGWAGKRVVQMSDLHIGPQVDDGFLAGTFDRVNALKPDVVVITGDFTSYEPDVFAHAEALIPLLPLGQRATFAVLGNHDYGPGWSRPEVANRIAGIAGDAGVRVLRNELAEIDGLQIAGLDDLWANRFRPREALSAIDRAGASLVLSHNPDTADEPVWGDYTGWILAGHTHGGQCKPPFLPAPLLPVRNRRYTSGAFALSGGRKMYINRGLGHLLRVRFNARPEVTVFTLQQA